jgi:hypothetical protein
MPDSFILGRHPFKDAGPPFDVYEVLSTGRKESMQYSRKGAEEGVEALQEVLGFQRS